MSYSTKSTVVRGNPTSRNNRRKWIRHVCGPAVSCRLVLDGGQELWASQIENVSPGGINVVIDRIVPAGKVLTLELRHRDKGISFERQARVTYLFRGADNRFILGAAFAWELNPADLEQLL